eukprot:8187000-Lingulodinium_polyedra.AAC.1
MAAAKRRPEESRARHLDRLRCCSSGGPSRGRRQRRRASTSSPALLAAVATRWPASAWTAEATSG